MLKVLGKLPRDVTVAVSGGPDSMAILDFLSNNHNVTAAYFDHGTSFGTKCKSFVKEFCESRDIDLVVGVNQNVIRPFILTPKRSLEDWCNRKEVPFLVDPANEDKQFMRSIIRHDILPNARLVNPGIEKTIKKLVEKSYEDLA